MCTNSESLTPRKKQSDCLWKIRSATFRRPLDLFCDLFAYVSFSTFFSVCTTFTILMCEKFADVLSIFGCEEIILVFLEIFYFSAFMVCENPTTPFHCLHVVLVRRWLFGKLDSFCFLLHSGSTRELQRLIRSVHEWQRCSRYLSFSMVAKKIRENVATLSYATLENVLVYLQRQAEQLAG